MILNKFQGGLEKIVIEAIHVQARGIEGIYDLYVEFSFTEFCLGYIIGQYIVLDSYIYFQQFLDDVSWKFAVNKLKCDVGYQSRLKMTFQERLSDTNSGQVKGLDIFVERNTLNQSHQTALIVDVFVTTDIKKTQTLIFHNFICERIEAVVTKFVFRKVKHF